MHGQPQDVATEAAVPVQPQSRGASWWPALAALAAAAAAFLPVLGNGWVYFFDDDENFFQNVDFQGLGLAQLRWAWTTLLLGVYQPLAWMFLECQYALWGLDARGYHLTSLALHVLNSAVLYALTVAVLERCVSPSVAADRRCLRLGAAAAALLFTIHPLRVEVVAWASCQPYLPCALFSMLAVLAYLKASDEGRAYRTAWLAGAWALLAAALLCKAVAVPVPAVLILLDVYPLRRLGPGRWSGPGARAAWLEKVPFFALILAFMILALLGKRSNNSLIPVQDYGPWARVTQSCYGVWFYLVKTLVPTDLTAYYPLPRRTEFSGPVFVLAVLAAAGATAAAFALRRRWPGLLAAWVCYLVLLAPNAGIVRIGNQIAADRYSYVASFGWVVLAAWGIAWLQRWGVARPGRRPALVTAGLVVVVGLSVLTWRQCLTWRTTEALWTNVLERGDANSAVPHLNLGADLARRGKYREALAEYDEALRIYPASADAINLKGAALDHLGRSSEAAAYYAEAARLEPDYADAQNNLGTVLARQGRLREAAARFTRAVASKPRFALAHRNLARALAQQGRIDEAARHFAECARLEPDRAEHCNDLGIVEAQRGRLGRAIEEFSRAVRLDPRSIAAHTNLGLALQQTGRLDEAITHLAESVRLEPGRAENHLLLASALASRGKPRESRAEFSRVLELDPHNAEAREGLEALARRGHR
jgi:tetratricopeptide (TPR) repeat protein